jgi:hypothetical protein
MTMLNYRSLWTFDNSLKETGKKKKRRRREYLEKVLRTVRSSPFTIAHIYIRVNIT